MDWYVIILRLIHIAAGIFWVGAAFVFFLFIQPSVRELGPEGQQFMGHLGTRKKLPGIILISAILTVLAGILLYIRVSDGFSADWIGSGPGIGFTIGGVAALVTVILGLIITKPAADRMGALGQQIAAAGGPPKPEQLAEMQRLQGRLLSIGWVSMVLLVISVVTMATARYY
jgi:uncharacterized membrane protein